MAPWLVIALALAGGGRFERVNSRTPQGRSERGLMSSSGAFFEFAPASGAGMGTACACAAVTGAKGEVITVSRASAAECYANDGQTLTQCGNNLPRVSSGSALSSWLGLWVEGARTNALGHSRDLSQAVWTATDMTCVRDAVGMRNDTDGASTCTASAPGATVAQVYVTGAATRTGSLHIKRGGGTGTVEVSTDGAAWTDITASLSASAWRRVVPGETSGCAGGNCIVVTAMTTTAANPQLALRLGTAGDSVLVDFAQQEAGDEATSPIATGAAAAGRGDEIAYATTAAQRLYSLRAYTDFGISKRPAYSALLEAYESGSVRTWLNSQDGASDANDFMQCYWRVGVDYVANSGSQISPTFGGVYSHGCEYDGATTMTNSLHGRVYTTTPGAAFTPPLSTRLYLGNLDIGGNAWNGVIKGACGDSTPGKCASSTNLGFGDVAFVGDSITLGDTSSPTRPPYVAATTARRVGINLGIGGYTAAQCRAMYEASVVGKGYGTVVLACSVNSINNGLTAAQTWVDLQAVADSAIGAGLHVVLMKTTPWATYAGWSAAKQTHTDDLWTTMQAYCSAHSSDATCVSTDSLGTGSPLALAAGYDYGDHLHLNAAGSTALGVLMAGGIP